MKGYMMVSNLSIALSHANPSMGFIPQKIKITEDMLSGIFFLSVFFTFPNTYYFSADTLSDISKTSYNILNNVKVSSLNNAKQICLHTDFFCWLNNNFIIDPNYQIAHFIEFRHTPFLKDFVGKNLQLRAEIKNKMLTMKNSVSGFDEDEYQNLNIQSLLYKLYNNGW